MAEIEDIENSLSAPCTMCNAKRYSGVANKPFYACEWCANTGLEKNVKYCPKCIGLIVPYGINKGDCFTCTRQTINPLKT